MLLEKSREIAPEGMKRLSQLGHPAADFGLVLRVLRATERFHIESGPLGFSF